MYSYNLVKLKKLLNITQISLLLFHFNSKIVRLKILIILSVLACGCVIFSHLGQEIPVIYLERTSCYGECPVYKLEISNSGKLFLSGIKNVKFTGNYCSKIDLRDLDMLKEEFKKQNFQLLQDTYLSRTKDLPTTIICFTYEGRQKRVVDYDDAPAALKRLEKMLETIVDTTNWKACK